MKATKMSSLDTAELATKSQEAEEQLFRLRFQMGMGQFDGLKKYRALRKDRARMLTEIAGRRKNEANAAAVGAIQSAAKASAASAKKTVASEPAVVKKAAAAKKPAAKTAKAETKKPAAAAKAATKSAPKAAVAKTPAAKKPAGTKEMKAK